MFYLIIDIFVFAAKVTAVIAVVAFLFKCIAAFKKNGMKGTESDETGSSLLCKMNEILQELFREAIAATVLIGVVAVLFNGVIFAYSLRAGNTKLTAEGYIHAVLERRLNDDTPISGRTNLNGVTKSEMEDAFGKNGKESVLFECFQGVTESGREYRIKVVYMPIIWRVIWYETEIVVG